MHKADGDLKHCTAQFGHLVDYYCAKPSAGQSTVTMEHFFASWYPFVQDFRQYWERVMAKRCVVCVWCVRCICDVWCVCMRCDVGMICDVIIASHTHHITIYVHAHIGPRVNNNNFFSSN